MKTEGRTTVLDRIEHVALSVTDLDGAVAWYTSKFRCTVDYRDATWALLTFDNVKLALVIPEQHPPHIAFASSDAEAFGKLTTHRDGTRSTYVKDPAGNDVEIMAKD
jgi:catechol 2,3-dioxygenase-like lactoylglutathione lyase family enzyme